MIRFYVGTSFRDMAALINVWEAERRIDRRDARMLRTRLDMGPAL